MMSRNGKVTASLLLTTGKESNFHHWRKTNVVELQKVLGDVANVMKMDKATGIPPVVAADYAPDGPMVDPETLRALRTDADEKSARAEDEPCAILCQPLSLLSPGSRVEC